MKSTSFCGFFCLFVFCFFSENQKSNTLQLHLQGLMEILHGASLVAQVIKTLLAAGGLGSISGLGESPGGGHGNPPQYSCL